MSRMTLEQLGPLLRDKRGKRGIREVAAEIGVSAATLSRVETGKQPDLDTFAKVCKWLGINASEVLGCALPEERKVTAKPVADMPMVSAHFRAEKAMSVETAQHLGQLILTVSRAMEQEIAG